MAYILALDQGTTSSRAILFDRRGRIRGQAQKEFRQYYPRPGWVEHDPEEIWRTQQSVAVEAVTDAGLTPRDIAAIGITNQRETVIVWDRETGRPVHRAIVWQDRRTAAACEALQSRSQLIRNRSGLLIDAYFSATKIQWILQHVKGARKRAEAGRLAFGTVDSWLIWKLTDGRLHITDDTNASRTLLYNLKTGMWDKDLLRLFDVPTSMLPEVRASSEVYGEGAPDSFWAGVPLAGIAGDQQAALFGQACHRPGMVKNTYGTGCFVVMHTGRKRVVSKHKLLTTVAWRIGNRVEYALEGSIFIAGAVVQWLRDGLGLIKHARDVEALAAQVPDTAGVYFVPAFAGLGAPYWDPYARGTCVGLTRGTTAAHLARAALEAIAYQTADVVQAMEADSGIRTKEMRVDGGASVNNLLMQFQADILRQRVIRPQITETTALGAAYLAGLAVGYWKKRSDLAAIWREERTFRPNGRPADGQARLAQWHRALRRAGKWATD